MESRKCANQPFVSVVIPVLNDEKRLEICLKALTNQTYPKSCYEIIVVDNGSFQSLAPLASRYGVNLFLEKQPGSYAARNTGIRHSKGEIIAFTDADCIPAHDWLENGVRVSLSAKNMGLVGGRINIIRKGPRPSGFELYDQLNHFDQKKFIEKHNFSATANTFIRKRIFRDAGMFSDQFKSFGDVEWGKRVAASGYTLYYAPDAVVCHPAVTTLKKLVNRSRRLAGGTIRMRRRLGYERWVDVLSIIRHWFGLPVFVIIRILNPHTSGFRQKLDFLAISVFVHIVKGIEEIRLQFKPDTDVR